jgi:hypothetical protein
MAAFAKSWAEEAISEVSQRWDFEAVATGLSANALGNPPIFKAIILGKRLSIGTVGEQADNLEATRRAAAYQDCHGH